MDEAILTLNAGSSSIKFALYQKQTPLPPEAAMTGQIDGIGARPHLKATDRAGNVIENADIPLSGDLETQHHGALDYLVQWLQTHHGSGTIVGVGHRVVHGADRYARPMVIDDAALPFLKSYIPLAPLHQPHNLAGVEALRRSMPGIPQIACFDTAFHRTQPEIVQRYALPRALSDKGLRRYGFHGLSYEYIADTLPEHLGPSADGRVIVAHLGNGASLCAMHHRRSVATTMGFSPIEGLVMGTRSGSLDPGILLYLMEFEGYDLKALTKLLYKESGLLGVSGESQDMRTLLASPTPAAAEAVSLFCHRIVREIGSLAAALEGLDALVFTGGIGEHAAAVRSRVGQALAWLGVGIDEGANDAHALRISRADSLPVLVLPTNEEWMIARHTAELIG